MNQPNTAGNGVKKSKPLTEKSQVTIRTTLITVLGSVLVAGFTTVGTIYATKSTVAQATEGASRAKTSVDELKNRVAAAAAMQESIAVPVGTIIAYAGPVTDEADLKRKGWLPCDGRAVSRSEYSNLFAVIKQAWGEGDRGTTFNLPDLRGMFLRGVNGNRGDAYRDPEANARLAANAGADTGNNVGSIQANQLSVHSHRWATNTGGGTFKAAVRSWVGPSATVTTVIMEPFVAGHAGSANDDDSFRVAGAANGSDIFTDPGSTIPKSGEVRPNNAYVNYLIKY